MVGKKEQHKDKLRVILWVALLVNAYLLFLFPSWELLPRNIVTSVASNLLYKSLQHKSNL